MSWSSKTNIQELPEIKRLKEILQLNAKHNSRLDAGPEKINAIKNITGKKNNTIQMIE